MSRPGSEHGYDVVDPTRIDPELGNERELERLVHVLNDHGLGLLLDIVPNHMGVHETNTWWGDVLEHGQESAYARFFDIDWRAGGGKVLLPVLGAEPSEVLAGAELEVERDKGGSYWLKYYDNRFPLRVPPELHVEPGPLAADDGPLLEAQAYRLMKWDAKRPLNYRRFFEINDLVGLRMEDPVVFESVHATLFEWIARGWVSGLRVDHPDGLRDPAAYLRALDQAARCAVIQAPGPQQTEREGVYIVVEKILTGSERLRPEWPVDGTTGYEQLNVLTSVLLQPSGVRAVRDAYVAFTGQKTPYAELAYQSKKQVLSERFSVELGRVAGQVAVLFRSDPTLASLDARQLNAALLEIIACFPVYRSYVSPKDAGLSDHDRELVSGTITAAHERVSELPAALFAGLRSVLLLDAPLVHDPATRAVALEALLKLQQLTGPAAAKGVEDTALYRYFPLTCLNEVGGEPDLDGFCLDDFHRSNAERATLWPWALTATSTHDTKRSEDVRARIAALSEIPERWSAAIRDFSELTRAHKSDVFGEHAPSANDEYLFYQTLLGIWPDESSALEPELLERIQAYLEKAAREAKLHTSWTDPNPAYEEALRNFAAQCLDVDRSRAFLERFRDFVMPIIRAGRYNSLAQTVVKLGAPGIPDSYQGSELWDLSLVDPDNRRPVDFELRKTLIDQLEREADGPVPGPDVRPPGLAKMAVLMRGLRLRKERHALFTRGSYVPLHADGAKAAHVVAFARVLGKDGAVFLTSRWFIGLRALTPETWDDTRLPLRQSVPAGTYRDVLSGDRHRLDASELDLAQVFRTNPYAILERLG